MEEATTHELLLMGVDEADSSGFNTHPRNYSSYLDLRPCAESDWYHLVPLQHWIRDSLGGWSSQYPPSTTLLASKVGFTHIEGLTTYCE